MGRYLVIGNTRNLTHYDIVDAETEALAIATVFEARPGARMNATALEKGEVGQIYDAMVHKTRARVKAKFRKNLESGA